MAVRHCWESTYTARAIEYRRGHGIGLESIRLAALVQRLIVADASAVAFSANPVTGSRKEVVIETAWGLGESIVGGTVTPDSYVLRKEDSAVVSRRIADKHLMTVPLQGGTSEVQTPSFLRTRPVLDDEQSMEIARLVIDLERAMGVPVDVECAYENGRLVLLQCRPVTALDDLCDFPAHSWKREEHDTDKHTRGP